MKKNLAVMAMILMLISCVTTSKEKQVDNYKPISLDVGENIPLAYTIPARKNLEINFTTNKKEDWKIIIYHLSEESKEDCKLARIFESVNTGKGIFSFLGDKNVCYSLKSEALEAYRWSSKKSQILRLVVYNGSSPTKINILITKE